jgi:hypothetical protein
MKKKHFRIALVCTVLVISMAAVSLPYDPSAHQYYWTQGTGTISSYYSPGKVYGKNTRFLDELLVGDYIGAYGRGSRNTAPITFEAIQIISIESDTELTIQWKPTFIWQDAKFWWLDPYAGIE